MSEWRLLPSDKVPPGHTFGFEGDVALPGIPDDAQVALVMPTSEGTPIMPALAAPCFLCGQPCWVSVRSPALSEPSESGFYRVCYDCMDLHYR